MNALGTIILTRRDPALLAALRDRLPGLEVLVIEHAPPAEMIAGPVYCFVDWLLPAISGLEMCRRLRSAAIGAHAHVTLVLDEDDAEARRRALRAGADDYLVGPLTAEALLARLGALGVHPAGSPDRKLALGALTIDLAGHQMRWDRKVVPLRENELRLLAQFVEHPDRVLSRSSLIALLGKDPGAIDERTVDVWVGRLRRSLKQHGVPNFLRTVHAHGYVFDSP